ncbi:MAG: hypothetical protein ACLTYN_07715 [Dysosmobacter welbionis]
MEWTLAGVGAGTHAGGVEAGEEGTTAPGILARLERPLTASALHSYLKRLRKRAF